MRAVLLRHTDLIRYQAVAGRMLSAGSLSTFGSQGRRPARCGLHRDGAWGLLTINATSEFKRHRSLSPAILAMQDL
jgi:hypothetical protein